MAVRGQDITSVIKRQIQDFGGEITMVDVGTVVASGDGVATVQGLSGARYTCLLYTSPSPRDGLLSRMPSSA